MRRTGLNTSTPRREQVINLREAGLTYAAIGRRLGLSRERVRQIHKGISMPKKPSPKFDVLLTPGKVALMLGVHENTVRRWSNRGILQTYRVGPRGDRRFRWGDVDKLLRKSQPVTTT